MTTAADRSGMMKRVGGREGERRVTTAADRSGMMKRVGGRRGGYGGPGRAGPTGCGASMTCQGARDSEGAGGLRAGT